ncbi:PAS domain S-box protein [Fodinibius sediminis]|uniref:histidine kinase n=1 Tax=Fodinibius sediminis TaxID=1214077 RepID=A0A521FCQ3_9BACT|nr:PAS domain S-box protein [Fodinibius sediminis]SMO93280.1 PAS domain S-box-containing protein [Fodinibius sediminis]
MSSNVIRGRIPIDKVYHILLIDNDERDIDLIETELNKQDIEVRIDIIQQEEELINHLDKHPPDLVISDYNLPRLTGTSALRIVRDQHPQLPFILIAGSIGEEKAVDIMLEGASDYAMKDNPERLGAAVKRELQNYEQHLQKQHELEQAQKRQQSIIDSVDGIVWEADAQTFEFHFISSQVRQLLGYTPKEWLTTPNFWQDRIHPDDRQRAVIYCHYKTQQGENHEFEYRMLDADGEYVWLRDYVTVIMDDEKPSQLRGIMLDITQQKKAERQRDKAYQIAHIGHWEFDVIKEELYWSDTVKELHEVNHNYKPDIESALGFYKEGQDRKKITAVVDRAIETGESFEVELQIVTAKGNQRWVRALGEAELRNGKCVRIFGSTQDITDRKEIEQKLRDVVEHSTNMFYRHDTEHELSYVSPQAVDFLGCTPEEAKRDWMTFLTDHAVNKKGIQTTKKAIDTGKPQPPFPLQLQKTTGEVLWVRVNEAPITENGETVAIVGSLTDITEQKELQDLLHRTNRMAQVGSWEIDFSEQEEGEVYWSEMTKELLEVEADYVPSVEDSLSFIEPQSRTQARKAFAQAVSQGTPYDNELLVRTGKGHRRWIRNIGQAEFKEGECIRVYGSFQDITDRKVSEKKYRNIFDLSPQPMWVYDPETLKFLDVNRAAIKQYGYSYEEFMDMTLKDIRPEDDIPELMEAVKEMYSKKDSYHEELFRHKTKEGSLIYVNIKRNTIDYEGRKAAMVLAEDVTEKLEAERELHVSEQKFKSLVQSGASMIAVLNEEGTFTYVSDTYEQITGWSSQELTGNDAFGFIHPDDKDQLRTLFRKLQTEKENQHSLPFRFKHKKGHWIWVESTGSDLSHSSALNGYVINSHDVTERRYYTALEKIERDILKESITGHCSLSALTEKLLLKLEDLHPGMTCSVQEVVDGKLQNLAAPSLPSAYLAETEGVSIGNNICSCGTAAYLKEAVITDNIYKNPRWEGHRHLGDKYDFSACWSNPILDSNQNVVATFAVYYKTPQSPSEREKNTIDRVGHLLRLLFDSFEKEKAEQKLALREQRFKSLVQDGSDLIAILDQNGNYKYVSPTSESILGISPEEFVGNNALDYIHDKHKDRIQQALATLLEKKRTKVKPFLFKNGQGEWRWIETIITNLLDTPAVEGLIANSRDVTAQIEREQKLKESLEQYEYVTKATDDVVYDWDIDGDILEWDDSFRDKFPYQIGKKQYTIKTWAQNVHPDDLAETEESLYHILENTDKSKWEQEYRFQKNDGSYATVFERGFIIRDDNGKAIRMIGSLQDITQRKQHEKELQASLKEKETLLQEIHHRVKNNLAVVSGMMQLQAFSEEDERLKVKLFDSVVRIKTMASIHELLYQSNSYSHLQLDQNIKKLISNVSGSIQKNANVTLNFDLEPAAVNINQAIPCSLIVNEVVTNVYKHAFDQEQEGALHIEIFEENNNVHIRIRDNGRGLPDNFDRLSKSNTLGLQLIDTLAIQLDAKYGYEPLDQGTLFTLNFEKADIKGIGNAHLE